MATPNQTNNGDCKSSSMITKATRGRQKIPIKKLEDKSNRQVTFSKRRNGLFKKASELCVLCGANVAIIVFSPRGKPFCFGHPSVDGVLDRFDLPGSGEEDLASDDSIPCFEQFNEVCREALKQLEEEKQRSIEIEKEKEERKKKGEFWWDVEPIDNMGLDELEAYVKAMEELRNNAARRANNEVMGEVFAAEAAMANAGGLGIGFAYQNVGFGSKSGFTGGYGDGKF